MLRAFATALVRRLVAEDLLEVAAGSEQRVADHLAGQLATAGEGAQLVSSTFAALIASPDVEELFADKETIGDMIIDLGA